MDFSLKITRTEDMDTVVARGRILWDSIYEPHAVKLHDKLSSYHPDFMGEYMCAHTVTSIIRPFSLPHSSSLDCSGQRLRSTLRIPFLRRIAVSGKPFLIEATEREKPVSASLELNSPPAIRPRSMAYLHGRCGEQAKGFCLFAPGLYLGVTRCFEHHS